MNFEMPVLSSEEARNKILAGEALRGYRISKIEIQDKEIPGSVIITDCQIGVLNFSNTTIQGAACFDKSIFLEKAVFGWESSHAKTGVTIFQKTVAFNECVFQGKSLFGGTQFKEVASFKGTSFQKEAIFQEAYFYEQAFFWKTNFSSDVSFRGSTFGLEGHFDHSQFFHNVSFECAKFLEKEGSFNNILIYGNLNFAESYFQGYLAFRKAIVHGEVDFKRSKFDGEADFQDAQFKSKVSFRNATFTTKVSFLHTIFSGLASFLATKFSEADFLNAQFHDEALFNFDRNTRASLNEADTTASFSGFANFMNVRFHKRAVFEEVVFEKSATFANSFFGEQASFMNTKFQGPTTFNNVYCNQELSAIQASFSEITFDYANINRRLDLSEAKFEAISFYKASLDLIVVECFQIRKKLLNERPSTPHYDRVKEEYLILKESFQQRGLAEEEDWAYRKFRQMKRKAISQKSWARILRKNKEGSIVKAIARLFVNLIERIFVDRGTGYGTQPLNIGIVAISVILLFGYIYSNFPEEFNIQQQGIALKFSQAIYLSFSTFTTMGLNDLQPKLDSPLCYATGIEAFLGIFIMTLFVGTFTRKIIR